MDKAAGGLIGGLMGKPDVKNVMNVVSVRVLTLIPSLNGFSKSALSKTRTI